MLRGSNSTKPFSTMAENGRSALSKNTTIAEKTAPKMSVRLEPLMEEVEVSKRNADVSNCDIEVSKRNVDVSKRNMIKVARVVPLVFTTRATADNDETQSSDSGYIEGKKINFEI